MERRRGQRRAPAHLSEPTTFTDGTARIDEIVDRCLGRVLEALPNAAFTISLGGANASNAAAAARLAADDGVCARLVQAARSGKVPAGFAWIALPERGAVVAIANVSADQARYDRAVSRWALSPRQAEVLRGLLDGLSNAQIAHLLGCRPRTVETHVTVVLRRADVSSRLELVAAYWADV